MAAFADAVVAQIRATLIGSVRDSSVKAIPGARLILTNLDNGEERNAISDSNGNFSLSLLPSGSYRLQCRANGFKEQRIQDIVLGIGETRRLDIDLIVGEVSETIEISAGAQTERTELSTSISGRQIQNLALNGRNFLDLPALVPGVGVTTSYATSGPGGVGYIDLSGQRTGNGARAIGNQYTLDGVSANDRFFKEPGVTPALDAIESFKVESNSYSPESGGASSAQITIQTKSGVKAVHGSAYEYFSNDRLNARNFFDLADNNHDGKLDRPLYQRNQFGFSVGGPTWKNQNHTFFFGSAEWLRLRAPQSLTLTVPTAKMRQGDFTEFGDGNAATTNDVDIRNPFAAGHPVFAGNVIPQALWNAVAKDVLALLPQPNRPGLSGNLAAAPAFRNRTTQFSVRLDHHFNTKESIYGRFIYSDLTAYSPFGALTPGAYGDGAVPGFGLDLTTANRNLVVNYQRAWTGQFSLEARFGLRQFGSSQQHQNRGNPLGLKNGIAGLFATGNDEIGVPHMQVIGLSPFGDVPNTNGRNSRDYQYDGAVTYVKGLHVLRFGVSFQPQTFAPSIQNAVRGSFSFGGNSVTSGLGFADFLLGLPDSASSGSSGRADFKGKNYHWFAQDNWKLGNDVTLIYGVRYEYEGPLVDQKLQAANFDLNTRTVIIPYKNGQTAPLSAFRTALTEVFSCSGTPCFPVRSAADLGIHPGLLMPDRNNFSPRFNLAWKLTENFAVRGGYGMYYRHNEQSAAFKMAARPPFWNSAAFGPAVSPCLLQTQQVCEGAARLQIQNVLASPRSGAHLSPVDPFLRTGYSQQWSLTLQRSFLKNWLLEVDYVGVKGSHLFNLDSRNYRLPGTVALNDNTREFFPYLLGMEVWTDSGFSQYHGLQARLEKRLSEGLSLLVRYTWSKSLDNVSNGSSNPFNRLAEKGRSDLDLRHRWEISSVYKLPFGHGRKFAGNAKGISSFLIKNWQLGLYGSWNSATPFTVDSPFDFANIGRTYANRPDLVGDPNKGPKTVEQWSNTSAFANPMRGSFGTAGRNILDGDTQTAIQASLNKDTLIAEKVKIQLSIQVSNIANHTNYGIPKRKYTPHFSQFAATSYPTGSSNNINPDFGRIFSADNPRMAQIVLKLTF